MTIQLDKKATEDIALLRRENPKYAAKLWDLILDIQEHPFSGIGEPEQLRGNHKGWWSRRITKEHRLVCRIQEEVLEIASCHGHYGDK